LELGVLMHAVGFWELGVLTLAIGFWDREALG
jgi:hypothetical protein